MSITGNSTIEYRKDEKTRYVEEDNIKDITKDDLKKLKSTLKTDEETNLDSKLTKINDDVERIFNGYISGKDERETTITYTTDKGTIVTDTPKNIIMNEEKDAAIKKDKLDGLANYIIDLTGYEQNLNLIKDAEIKETLKEYEFELKDLRKEISVPSNTGSGDKTDNPFLYDENGSGGGEKKEGYEGTKEGYEGTKDYIDGYGNFSYANVGDDRNIENIYRDKDVRESLERILDNEENKELHKGTFNLNLGIEEGLAGIIIKIREAIAEGEKDDPDVESNAYKLYEQLTSNSNLVQDGESYNLTFDRKAIKDLIDLGFITYDRKGGWDNELRKIAKILSQAQRTDLDTFASLLQSKPDITVAVKERNNALELTGNSRENLEQESLINENNVLEFLCDFNSDGQISAEYKKKFNKKQENQGDVGTLFGQQVLFTIEQAINTKNVELGEPEGEQLVISNIIKNMEISDSRYLEHVHLKTMRDDPTKCTKENLAKLLNGSEGDEGEGDEGEGIYPMPEMKTFFLDSIKKINGGSEEVNPDLYDTLVGKEAENLMALYENEANLKSKLDEILAASTDPVLQAIIKEQGLVRVRETILIKIMTVLDNVDLTFNDGTHVSTGDKTTHGLSKGREIRNTKNELLEKTWKNLVQGGIYISPSGTLTLSLGFGQSGISESGNRKRSRSIGSGVTLGTEGVLVDILNLSGDIAFQYNKNKVISADLSRVHDAQYLGIEGSAGLGLGFSGGETTLGVRASAGINRQKDPEIGINQIDKQYRAVSEEIFDVRGMPLSTLTDKNKFQSYIENKIITAKSDAIFGDFVTNNIVHLKSNLEFIVRYMAANKFFGENGIFKNYPDASKINSVNALLDIIQAGNIELRRHDVISGLHGKIALTKLSFGVTTSMFTLKTRKKEEKQETNPAVITGTGAYTQIKNNDVIEETVAQPNLPEDAINYDNGQSELPPDQVIASEQKRNEEYTPVGTYEGSEELNSVNAEGGVGGGTDKYGALFMYVGLRVSTWKNMYAPNVPQYLFTQYETGQGIGTEYLDNPSKDLNKYGEYLIALYNDKKNRLSYTIDAGKLVLTFTPETGSDLTLARFLNIHATKEADKNFSLKGNVLTIGNVGDIGAYTITEAKGVRRVLCLGSKKVDEAIRITGDNATTTVDEIKPVENGYKEWSQKQINTTIDEMTGTGKNLELAKSESKKFFDSEGKLTKPAGFTVTFEPKRIENNTKLTSGDLLIEKNKDGSYRVVYETTTAGKVNIIYRDMKEYEIARADAKNNPENYKPKESIAVTNLFTFEKGDMLTAKNELATLLTSIEELEDKDKQAYADFLNDASAAEADDGTIDDEELGKAILHLETLMAKFTTPTTFDGLKKLLNGNDYNVKAYIVDRFKQILAREPKKYIGHNIGDILGSHIGWETVVGPSNIALPAELKKDMQTQRADLKKTYATTKYNETPTVNPNLIGYTAFYRELAKKFSITSLGETGYQGEIKSLTQTSLAKTWFRQNFKENKHEVERLATSLEAKFFAQGKTVDLLKDEYETAGGTLETVEKLINGEQITIDSGNKISIDVNWVFYLLGDCCNESLGMEIKNINIQEFKKDVVVTGRYAATGDSEKIYKGGVDIYSKSHSITSRVTADEMKVGIKGISRNIRKKDKNPEGTNETGGYT